MQLTTSDIPFESNLIRFPGVSQWIAYINMKKSTLLNVGIDSNSINDIILINSEKLWVYYERSVQTFPRSYKLWIDYTDTRSTFTQNYLLEDSECVSRANGVYERALMNLWTCPRLWINYLVFISKQKCVTFLRKVFNRALQALPITQHDMIWNAFLPLIKDSQSILSVDDAYKRYLMLHSNHIEEAVEWFLEKKATKESAYYIQKLLQDPYFQSPKERPKFYYWNKLAEVIKMDPYIENAEVILRNGCQDFIVENGKMWVTIADLFARKGRFADAIQVYEDALSQTRTVNDFKVIFGALTSLMKFIAESNDKQRSLFYSKLENLLDREPFLLNDTIIRSDPNNVSEWLLRSSLYMDKEYIYNPRERHELWEQIMPLIPQQSQFLVFVEAIETVNPKRVSIGVFADLWIQLALISDDPRFIFDISLKEESIMYSDIIRIYLMYAEYELDQKEPQNAIEVLMQSIDDSRIKNFAGLSEIWSLLLDLHISFSMPSVTIKFFERCIVSKAATIRHILTYANFLENRGTIDEMFRVYEIGIKLAGWPNSNVIWFRYLHKFINAYGSSKRERIRDLFEEALKNATPEFLLQLYVMYAYFEEQYGMIRFAMDIYKRAADHLPSDEIISVWISSSCRFLGVSKTRDIYEFAIKKYNNIVSADWCIRYATMEMKLQETERARQIFYHGSSFINPKTNIDFWDSYEKFEMSFGTKDTFAEMLSRKNAANLRFNPSGYQGLSNATADYAPTDENQVIEDVIANEILNKQNQLIPPTVLDAARYTKLDREKRRKEYKKGK